MIVDELVIIAGKDGNDAPRYLEKQVNRVLKQLGRIMSDRYSMVIECSDEDNFYLVHLPEFPWQQFHTHGKTYEEAAKHG